MEVLLGHFLGWTEENDGKPQSGYRGPDSNQGLTPDQASHCEEVSAINNFRTTDFLSEDFCATVDSKQSNSAPE
jgi:hypothetical protein